VVIVTALGDVVTVDPLIGDVLTNEFARAADELHKVRSNIAEEIMVLRTECLLHPARFASIVSLLYTYFYCTLRKTFAEPVIAGDKDVQCPRINTRAMRVATNLRHFKIFQRPHSLNAQFVMEK